jgi:hypothetical protein
VTFTDKLLLAPGVVSVAGRQVKRYHVASLGQDIEADVQEAALGFIAELLPPPDEETPPAGFMVLHRNSQGSFLDAYSWVWGNVIECRTAAAGIPFLGCDDDNPRNFTALTRPWIGCVWELAPFGHERSAWVRHVLQPDPPDLDAYLADTFPEGMVGGPD